MKLSEQTIDHLLATWPVGRLATVGPDDRPHIVPVVFAYTGGVLWLPVDGKPKSGGELTRVAHVRKNPSVSLLLDHYDPDWNRLWWVRVDGTAGVVETTRPVREEPIATVVAELRSKYRQYRKVPVLRDPPTLLAIRPIAVQSWCAGEEAPPIC